MTHWVRTEIGRLLFWIVLLLLLVVGLILLVAAIAGPARGHGAHLSPAENAWLNRQLARDGTKCCDERDVHVGQAVQWRLRGRDYEVFLAGVWRAVPAGRVLAPRPGDPSPFGSQALLFHSTWNGPGGPEIYCFLPEPLM